MTSRAETCRARMRAARSLALMKQRSPGLDDTGGGPACGAASPALPTPPPAAFRKSRRSGLSFSMEGSSPAYYPSMLQRRCRVGFLVLGIVLVFTTIASAELIRIDIHRRDSFGTYERLIGRAYF